MPNRQRSGSSRCGHWRIALRASAYDPQGNRRTETNPLGQVTHWDDYDAEGRPGTRTDPNGAVTRFGYDPLGRLVSQETGGELTQYAYTPTGNLERITQPDGSWLEYGYDPADRLNRAGDNLGNRIEYTLDAAGHRVAEQQGSPDGARPARVLKFGTMPIGRAQSGISVDPPCSSAAPDSARPLSAVPFPTTARGGLHPGYNRLRPSGPAGEPRHRPHPIPLRLRRQSDRKDRRPRRKGHLQRKRLTNPTYRTRGTSPMLRCVQDSTAAAHRSARP